MEAASTVTRDDIDAEHRKQEFEQEAGPAVGEMPPKTPDTTTYPEELRVDGTSQLGLWRAGGKAPTSGVLTLGGGAFEITDGQCFEKGEVIEFKGVAIVREIKQRDKVDPKTGIVVSCKQSHWAQIVDLSTTSPDVT